MHGWQPNRKGTWDGGACGLHLCCGCKCFLSARDNHLAAFRYKVKWLFGSFSQLLQILLPAFLAAVIDKRGWRRSRSVLPETSITTKLNCQISGTHVPPSRIIGKGIVSTWHSGQSRRKCPPICLFGCFWPVFALRQCVCVARGLVLIASYVPADDLLIQPKKPFFFHPYLTKIDFRCRKRNLEHRVYSLPGTKVQIGHLGLFHLQILNRDNFLKNFFI